MVPDIYSVPAKTKLRYSKNFKCVIARRMYVQKTLVLNVTYDYCLSLFLSLLLYIYLYTLYMFFSLNIYKKRETFQLKAEKRWIFKYKFPQICINMDWFQFYETLIKKKAFVQFKVRLVKSRKLPTSKNLPGKWFWRIKVHIFLNQTIFLRTSY